ncbi:pre-peptidase C-terminal domain-containing protein [Shewanella waksmanii]|uniref:pre-peptidase C-terminal domain-containing protein n=1 Tax=Shewanella waksmanii TaxID=213783 RepID=UPI003735842F
MKSLIKLAVCAMAGFALPVDAGSQYHRLIWDASPQTQATVGFTPDGSSNHVVKFGLSTDETTWQTLAPTATRTFASSLTSHFVKLSGLTPNSAVYYRVCDDSGCGQRMWFKTAPNDSSGFVAIAGGDTRTGWTNRQNGNRLVAKIRPLVILHGGDYTNANSASEMRSYLSDWQLTFSSDMIDGYSYQRIYPFVPTHGNHEDNNYNTLCQVFGSDYNQDGVCNAHDTYGAFNVSPLLRVYTLNSQFKNSGWSSYATAMNNWLSQDLVAQGASATWRIAQYHKPMFPHYSGKSDNTELHTWWADIFYNQDMNLVVESDTHINKITEALTPTSSGFNATTTGGTVYVGEGSWGAPARSANDPKSWTIDLASIQQFKVISVTSDTLTVRTAQFDASASTLSRAERLANPLALPSSVNWWQASSVGDKLKLVKAGNGLSIIDSGNTDPVDPPVAIPLQNGVAATSLSASKSNQLNFTLEVPEAATSLDFNITGGSGDADLYVKQGSAPTLSSYDCRPYKNGNAESCSMTPVQAGTYFVMLNGYASFNGVSLLGEYQIDSGGGDGGSGSFNNLAESTGNWSYHSATLPAGVTSLTVTISGGTGDADLYVQSGSQPTNTSYQCRPYRNGNEETCTLTAPQAGVWHFGVKAYSSFSGVSLSYQYQ